MGLVPLFLGKGLIQMNTCKYVRNELDDIYGLLELQDKILEIMVYIDSFCREHGIVYFLMGGSALGAMRHKGFIPWDDDFDIFMDYENFNKFAKACEKDLDTNRFYYQAMDTIEWPHFFAKLRLNNTAYLEEVNKGRKVHQGIFVDIMCLTNAAPEGFRRKLQYYSAGLLKARAVTLTNYHPETQAKTIEMAIAKIVVRGPIKAFLMHEVYKYNSKPSADQAHIFGRAKYENSFYPTDDFREAWYVSFEKVKLAVPNGVVDYLTRRYGKDFMNMPSEETKALYRSHPAKWDTKKSYKEYENI